MLGCSISTSVRPSEFPRYGTGNPDVAVAIFDHCRKQGFGEDHTAEVVYLHNAAVNFQ